MNTRLTPIKGGSVPDYQRIAVLILRLGGAIWSSALAVMWALYGVELAMGLAVQHYPAHTVIGNLAYVGLGLLLVLVAKPLVRLLGRGLDG
ncbi:hypothetical protein [Dyella choica]|uniref:Uncharacterized protein n=1 Tax=Dyella choica TaxID=1927959 RepID=A0A432M6Z7_9GAMM|nr:hypothetical protein [Dyella choica]RUL75925.1 hypothetical protein EKH80_09365 [Dyella choica]